jgi:Cellulose biosynthesis protein BcsS
MFREGRVRAAAFAVVAFVAGWFCVSIAPGRADDDGDSHLILFSGRDVWRNSAFMHGGLLTAPGSIDRDGLLLKVLMSGGLYRYNSVNLDGERVIGAETTIQVMPGFQVQRGNLTAKFFMGLDAEEHRLWPDDPSNSLRGHMWGMRVSTDLWYEPTDKTLATFDASLSTIATN